MTRPEIESVLNYLIMYLFGISVDDGWDCKDA